MSADAGDLLFQSSSSSPPQAPLPCWWEVPQGRAFPHYQTELSGFNNYPTELPTTTQTELSGFNKLPELTLHGQSRAHVPETIFSRWVEASPPQTAARLPMTDTFCGHLQASLSTWPVSYTGSIDWHGATQQQGILMLRRPLC